MLSDPPFEIVGMADIKIAALAMKHVSPERHATGLKKKQGFDKLSPNGKGLAWDIVPTCSAPLTNAVISIS